MSRWSSSRTAPGALAGAAVGDALGGAAEGNSPADIQARYGGHITGIVPPFNEDWRNARPIAPYHKGDGHITDDTLMTLALIDVYTGSATTSTPTAWPSTSCPC